MIAPTLSQQCLHAVSLVLHPSLLSQWTLRLTGIAALFACLQAISEITAAPAFFTWCNLCICLWLFNTYCVNMQLNVLNAKAFYKQESTHFLICAFPIFWAIFFFVLFGCFVLLDWIPYLGTALSILLTPLFFLLAAVPPLGILIQLALPVFIFPYLRPLHMGGLMLLISSFQFIQQPARTLSFFLLAYTPLVLTALLLWGSWETVYLMDRFSSIWSISLLQKSLLFILSGVCLGPATLFLAMMGILPVLNTHSTQSNPSQKRPKSNYERERAQWFMGGESE